MVFLITALPTFVVPVFQELLEGDPITTIKIQYKPFASFYQWTDFIDLSPLLAGMNDAYSLASDAYLLADFAVDAAENAQTTADTAYELAETAGSQAEVGIADAAAAYSLANSASDDAAAAQATADAALLAAGGAATSLPDCAYLVPGMFRTISVGFATPVIQEGQWTNAYSDLSGSGASAECKILLAAGDYDFSLGYLKASDHGKITIHIDGAGGGEFDTYNATTQLGQHLVGTLVTGLAAGLHTITVSCLNRHISSTGFHIRMSFLAIRKKP